MINILNHPLDKKIIFSLCVNVYPCILVCCFFACVFFVYFLVPHLNINYISNQWYKTITVDYIKYKI